MKKDKTYPLYPELTEQGKEEAQKIMDSFKPKLVSLITEILGDLYTDVSFYVESDHWTNYRNALMNGFNDYKRGKIDHSYDFKELRRAIYENNKEEIIKDLNQDLVAENRKLEERIKNMEELLIGIDMNRY